MKKNSIVQGALAVLRNSCLLFVFLSGVVALHAQSQAQAQTLVAPQTNDEPEAEALVLGPCYETDETPPTITCQASDVIIVDANCMATIGNYPPLFLSDNCPNPVSVTQSPAPGTMISGAGFFQPVTLTATDFNGNSSDCTFNVRIQDATRPNIVCPADVTIAADANCSGTLGTYAPLSFTDNCGTSGYQTNISFGGNTLSGHDDNRVIFFQAYDNSGNSAACAFRVTLKDVTPPTVSCPPNITVNPGENCSYTLGSYAFTSQSDNCSSNITTTQSPVAGTVLTGTGSNTYTVTLTANDGHGNTSSCPFTIRLQDISRPEPVCPPDQNVSLDANCTYVVPTFQPIQINDNCGGGFVKQFPAPGTILSGHNTVRAIQLSAVDNSNNEGVCAFFITLKDVTPPNVVCPSNVTVNADAACNAVVPSFDFLSKSDNCSVTVTKAGQTPAAGSVINGVGNHTVTLTASDGNGNTATCQLTINVRDITPPNIQCPPNRNLNLSSNCLTSLSAYSPSADDNCGFPIVFTQSPVSGTVLSGHNSVHVITLTANDTRGNTASCTFSVTLKDVTPPAITCPSNVTLNADGDCAVPIGSYALLSKSDNCASVIAETQSPLPGTIISGHNSTQTVTFTSNDGNGNTATCAFVVTLKDVTPPAITCPSNVTLNADADCAVPIGSYALVSKSDNCASVIAETQSPAAATIISSHNSTQTVTFTANDGNGNTATCAFVVTLKDVTPPSITCPSNVTLNADADCAVPIGSYALVSKSDNCASVIAETQSPATATIISGHNSTQTVTFTANDGNGNTATCAFVVTLKDVTPPAITCPSNVTLNADADCAVPIGSYALVSKSDNCASVIAETQSPAAATIISGHNSTQTVTFTANDGNGNTATCAFVVTLKDVTPPSITCPSNVTLNADGDCAVPIGSFALVSKSDNCASVISETQSPAAATIISGHNSTQTVTFTANDGNGNTQTCAFVVTLKDVTPPTVVCKLKNEASLNASGQVSITPADIFESGADNCGVLNLVSVLPNLFTCNTLGNNAVTLTVNDGNGNVSTCTTNVFVLDKIAPTMQCRPVTLNLDAFGQASLTPAQVNNGSFDNCTLSVLTLSQTQFSCANVGNNTVVLTGTDQSGNKSQCSAVITVRDLLLPTAKCKNVTVNLSASGMLSLNPTLLNNGSTDNCTLSFSATPSTFSCANVGNNIVTLRATDSGGNTATCTSIVTVKDQSAPLALCKSATVFLDQSGQGTLSVAQVDNGSSDACGILSRTLNRTDFNCSELGNFTWPVTLTVRDVNGNTASCIAQISVKDVIPPVAVCENTTVQLGANGIATVYPAELAQESFDNCAVWTYSPVAKNYYSSNLGQNNLSIIVKDWSGNAATCVSVITVQPYQGDNLQDNTSNRTRGAAVQEASVALNIYPNPNEGRANVAFWLPTEQAYLLRLFDLSGREVWMRQNTGQGGENLVPINLDQHAAGVYLMELSSGGERVVKKMILNRL